MQVCSVQPVGDRVQDGEVITWYSHHMHEGSLFKVKYTTSEKIEQNLIQNILYCCNSPEINVYIEHYLFPTLQ